MKVLKFNVNSYKSEIETLINKVTETKLIVRIEDMGEFMIFDTTKQSKQSIIDSVWFVINQFCEEYSQWAANVDNMSIAEQYMTA